MELKDFIKGTIADISQAIEELNNDFGDSGLVVNPDPDSHIDGTVYYSDSRVIQNIDFNLSISVSDTKEKGGGVKINVLNAGINSEVNNRSVSTIKFSIPVVFPAPNSAG